MSFRHGVLRSTTSADIDKQLACWQLLLRQWLLLRVAALQIPLATWHAMLLRHSKVLHTQLPNSPLRAVSLMHATAA